MTQANQRILIGTVSIDSGQLLLIDPAYIDDFWKRVPFQDIRIYENIKTKDRIQYKADFGSYEQVIQRYGKTANELLSNRHEWVQLPVLVDENELSYNAVCHKTNPVDTREPNFGQIAELAVATRTGYGDGVYKVYATLDVEGYVKQLTIDFI